MASRKLRAAVQSALTHGGNEQEVKIVDPEFGVKNNLSPNQLQVSDDDGIVNTHFSNLVSAATKKVLAGTDGIFVHKSIGSEEDDSEAMTAPLPEEGFDSIEAASDDIEEAEEVDEGMEADDDFADVDEDDEDLTDDIENELVNEDEDDNIEDELVNEDEDAEDSEEDSDEEEETDDEEIDSAFSDDDLEDPSVSKVIPFDQVLGGNEEEPVKPQQSTTELNNGSTPQQQLEIEAIDLVDADNMSDTKIDDLEFVACGNKIHAIKANRIIATLSKKKSIIAGVEDDNQLDDLADIVTFECEQQGLRAGLKSCGFALAKVSVKGNRALRNQVEAKTQKLKAMLVEQRNADRKCWQQCLALACEGINRKMFPGYKNPLRASLVASLQSVGIGNADKVVRTAFKNSGTETMAQIVSLATRLQAMPEDVRDNMAEQLDMTVEPDDDVEANAGEEHFIGDTVVNSVVEDEEENDELEADVDDDLLDDVGTVEAALSNPLRRAKKVTASNKDSLTRLKGLSFSLY